MNVSGEIKSHFPNGTTRKERNMWVHKKVQAKIMRDMKALKCLLLYCN